MVAHLPPPVAGRTACMVAKNGDEFCANRAQCHYWFRRGDVLYKIFNCAVAYPRRK